MKRFTYLPYGGSEAYAFLGCSAEDESVASKVAASLISRGVRLANHSCGGNADDPQKAADSIAHCSGAVIFLSEKGIRSLAFRNMVNYLLSLRKPLICVRIGDFPLAFGLEMQLANVPVVKLTTVEETSSQLLQSGVLTQEMMGMGMKKRSYTIKRGFIVGGMVLAACLIFAVCVLATVHERSSAAYQLQGVDGQAYVCISQYGEEGLLALSGKTVGELDLSGGSFSNLNAVENITAKTINVSDIPAGTVLRPLTKVNGLTTVKISQDQIVYAAELCDAGLTVLVIR